MSDVRMVLEDQTPDLAILAGDLERDDTLRTAVLISIFSDARAGLEDEVPDGSSNRRGWWADRLLPRETREFGSRLWLLGREVLSDATLATAEEYVVASLEWLVDDGIAELVDVTATRLDGETMFLEVQITRGTATEVADAWAAVQAVEVETGPARVKLIPA